MASTVSTACGRLPLRPGPHRGQAGTWGALLRTFGLPLEPPCLGLPEGGWRVISFRGCERLQHRLPAFKVLALALEDQELPS